MTPASEAAGDQTAALPHASRQLARPGSCARCQGPLRPRRRDQVYCGSPCRAAAVRERRALARADLAATLADLQALIKRVEANLRTLGLPR